jgi:uncharacterized protein (TIGR02284 family)
MAVKDRLAFDRDHALVVEAERGERASLNAYTEAIATLVGPEIQDLIETQQAGVQMAYQRLEAAALPA